MLAERDLSGVITVDPVQQQIASLVEVKENRASQILRSRRVRKRFIDLLYYWACNQNKPDTADVAICLGTSPIYFPEKFKKRVYWASMLYHKSKARRLIFTGESDDETPDLDQAGRAKRMAVTEFMVPEDVILTVGGNNTQENLVCARALIATEPDMCSALLVSENRHLIRARAVGGRVFSGQIRLISEPVGGVIKLDPDDWRVVIELMKAVVYNRTLFGLPDHLSDYQDGVRNDVDELLARLTMGATSNVILVSEREQSFKDWQAKLPPEFQF